MIAFDDDPDLLLPATVEECTAYRGGEIKAFTEAPTDLDQAAFQAKAEELFLKDPAQNAKLLLENNFMKVTEDGAVIDLKGISKWFKESGLPSWSTAGKYVLKQGIGFVVLTPLFQLLETYSHKANFWLQFGMGMMGAISGDPLGLAIFGITQMVAEFNLQRQRAKDNRTSESFRGAHFGFVRDSSGKFYPAFTGPREEWHASGAFRAISGQRENTMTVSYTHLRAHET